MRPGVTTRRNHQGFTLVELMIVVVIVGVLGVLASWGIKKYLNSSKTAEATEMLSAIRVAEELYRQETFVYLDVSEGSLSNVHPTTTPDADRHDFNGDGEDAALAARFRQLGVDSSAHVYFSYGVVAGRPGDAFPDLPTTQQSFGFPESPADPFFVAIAIGDLDGDGERSFVMTHSLTNQVFVENEGE
jgi:prepilin-type N-terminal cleavage/methylation domain-containing protein